MTGGAFKSLRINLRIGARTDRVLTDELLKHPPYARGRLVKALLLDGLRHRTGGCRVSTPSNSKDALAPTVLTYNRRLVASVSNAFGRTIRR